MLSGDGIETAKERTFTMSNRGEVWFRQNGMSRRQRRSGESRQPDPLLSIVRSRSIGLVLGLCLVNTGLLGWMRTAFDGRSASSLTRHFIIDQGLRDSQRQPCHRPPKHFNTRDPIRLHSSVYSLLQHVCRSSRNILARDENNAMSKRQFQHKHKAEGITAAAATSHG